MKHAVKKIIGLFLFMLLLSNIYLYTRTMALADGMIRIENNTKQLRLQNSELEKKVSSFNSLQNLNLVAEELGFTKKANLTYFENLQYALAGVHD